MLSLPLNSWLIRGRMSLMHGRLLLALLLGLVSLACQQESRQAETATPANPGIAVDVQEVRVGTLLPPVEVLGTTAPVREVMVRARSDGRLEHLSVGVGDTVEAGEEIARLETDLLEQTLQEASAALAAVRAEAASAATAVQEAQHTLTQAQTEAERYAQLAARGLVSRQEAEQRLTQARTAAERLQSQNALLQAARERVSAQEALVEQARERLSYGTIVSPMAGSVMEELTDPGNVLQSGDGIVRVGNLRQVEVLASVSELDLARVTLGSTVPVRLDAFPQAVWYGEVIRISPQADPVSRLVPLRILVPNPDGTLSAGLLARVEIAAAGDPRVIVPVSALHDDSRSGGAGAYKAPAAARGGEAAPEPATLFVVQETPDGPVARERRVTVGRDADGQVEVLTGLQEGERVVVRSARPLTTGAPLRLSAISQDAQRNGTL